MVVVNKLSLDQLNREFFKSNFGTLFIPATPVIPTEEGLVHGADDEEFGSIDEEDPIEMMNKKEEREKRKKRPKKPTVFLMEEAHEGEVEQPNCSDTSQELEAEQSPAQGIFETLACPWNSF